jgi:hypothetical protein
MRKEAAVAKFKIGPVHRNLPRGTEEDNKNYVMIVYFGSEIETWDLPKTKQEY